MTGSLSRLASERSEVPPVPPVLTGRLEHLHPVDLEFSENITITFVPRYFITLEQARGLSSERHSEEGPADG